MSSYSFKEEMAQAKNDVHLATSLAPLALLDIRAQMYFDIFEPNIQSDDPFMPGTYNIYLQKDDISEFIRIIENSDFPKCRIEGHPFRIENIPSGAMMTQSVQEFICDDGKVSPEFKNVWDKYVFIHT